jgi:tRNA threonylcarbamoyladenosine biosynthesis protein TsaE
MPVGASWEIATASPVETRRAGARLGSVLDAGDVVLLDGELGAGKTCFVQGLARGLGVPRERRVASPTFTLVNEHPGRVPLFHIDLYRIADASELEELGLREYLGGAGVAVVEWAERLGPLAPRERIEIRIEIAGERARRLRARAEGDTARRRLAAWSAAEGESTV